MIKTFLKLVKKELLLSKQPAPELDEIDRLALLKKSAKHNVKAAEINIALAGIEQILSLAVCAQRLRRGF